MRLLIAGAGPAGLGCAIALKTVDKSLDITVHERQRENELPGWGVTLNATRRFFLLSRTPVAEIVGWDYTLNGESLATIDSFRHLAVSRAHMLRDLRGVCSAMKIRLIYESAVSESDLKNNDLVIAADGVSSRLRNAYARELELEITQANSYHAWFGVRTNIRALRADIRTTDAGAFLLVSYPYEGDHCTAIVICLPDCLKRSGFDQISGAELAKRLSEIFAEELHGAPLLGNDASQWKRFETVRTARPMHENLLVVGDALHTAHFSYGAGTRMALDDAMGVAGAFTEVRSLGPRLGERFWELRGHTIRDFQRVAGESAETYERALAAASRGDLEAVKRAALDYREHFPLDPAVDEA